MDGAVRNLAVDSIARELAKHGLDTTSQDSGRQCVCGSDSRYNQAGLAADGTRISWAGEPDDPPWATIHEHTAQQVVRLLRAILEEAER